MADWLEIGRGVFVRRYEFLDQTIGCILGEESALVIDTRASRLQAEELRGDLRAITGLPIRHVLNTHGHSDHVFGNAAFRPAAIWAHARCPAMLAQTAEAQRAWLRTRFPDRAAELADQPLDVPDHLFDDRAAIDLGRRTVELRHLGRGHTDHDVIAIVGDAGVVFAGDLVEHGAPPAFEDSWPLDWPSTVRRLAALDVMATSEAVVVPGHGDPAGRDFLTAQLALLEAVADASRRVHVGEIAFGAGVELIPFDAAMARVALERGVRQLRSELTPPDR